MPTVKGREGVSAYMGALPAKLRRVLRGAAMAGGNVIADEARARSQSSEVASNVTVAAKRKGDKVTVTISVAPGWAYSVGVWEEYGTAAHAISVARNRDDGRFAGKGSLVIGGQFVGETVIHPGAMPHPFLRPALDLKEGEAIAAAQAYINARVSPRGVAGTPESYDE